MKINVIIFLFTIAILRCHASEKPLPPPPTAEQQAKIKAKYSQWSDEQLELKRAQLKGAFHDQQTVKHDDPDLSTSLGDLAVSMKRHDNRKQFDEITVELLRRDPSGGLIEKSNAML